MSVFALNRSPALGLGLAIDYSLFVVSRFREELAAGSAGPTRCARRWRRRAAPSVQLADGRRGAGVAARLPAAVPATRWRSAASLVALIAASIALLVLPGDPLRCSAPRVNALSPKRSGSAPRRARRRGFWYRLSRWVMRHAGVVIARDSAALLIALGSPFLAIKFTGVDAQRAAGRQRPPRRSTTRCAREFPTVGTTRSPS